MAAYRVADLDSSLALKASSGGDDRSGVLGRERRADKDGAPASSGPCPKLMLLSVGWPGLQGKYALVFCLLRHCGANRLPKLWPGTKAGDSPVHPATPTERMVIGAVWEVSSRSVERRFASTSIRNCSSACATSGSVGRCAEWVREIPCFAGRERPAKQGLLSWGGLAVRGFGLSGWVSLDVKAFCLTGCLGWLRGSLVIRCGCIQGGVGILGSSGGV